MTRNELINSLLEPTVVTSMLDWYRYGTGNFTRELRALATLALLKGVQQP